MRIIELSGKKGQGVFVLVDDEDFEYLNKFKWNLCHGYAQRFGRITEDFYRKSMLMHREIIHASKGIQVDHINHDQLDNRKSNLRLVTKSQNMMNAKKRTMCKSPYKGVCWFNNYQKWMSSITINGKKKFLGYFEYDKDAAVAYNKAAKKYFGEFSLLNKI